MIFCTHREVFRLRPAWRDEKAPECPGILRISPGTEDAEIREASCDCCGLAIGIPPRQWDRWMQSQGVV